MNLKRVELSELKRGMLIKYGCAKALVIRAIGEKEKDGVNITATIHDTSGNVDNANMFLFNDDAIYEITKN